MSRHPLARTRPGRRIPLSLALAALLAVTIVAAPALASHDDGDNNPATTSWFEQPVTVAGNDSQACPTGSFLWRLNGDADGGTDADLETGTYVLHQDGTTDAPAGTTATFILTVPTDGPIHVGDAKTLDFEIIGGSAAEIRMKGGPDHNLYDYADNATGEPQPGELSGGSPVSFDDYLHSPPRGGGQFFGLSHITVCFEVVGQLQVKKFIDVDADGVLDAGDVTSGDANLAGWEFEVYEGSDTSGTLVDTLTTDSDGMAGPIPLPAGTYTVLETNTGKTITTAVSGGSTTEVTTDNPVIDDVIAGETTTYTFGNACLITKVFEVTGVPAGTTGLVARYDTDLDLEVSGADVVTVALSDVGGGVYSGTAPDLFQIGDALEWEYAHTGTGSSEFVGSETFVVADGYPDCLRTNTVEFAPPTVTVNKFKDILADGLDGLDTQGLPGWEFNLWLDDGDGTLDAGDSLIETLTTDATGSATNTVDLSPGVYHVEEVGQANWTNTTPGGDGVVTITLDISENETVDFANAPESYFDVRFFDLTGSTDATIECDVSGTDFHDENATPETTFTSDNVLVGTYTCEITIVDP